MAAHAHRLAPSDDLLSSKGPQPTRQVIESLRDGPKKPEDRAPSSLTKRINQCKVHPDSGLGILPQKSLWLWYIVILSDEIQAGVVEQLAGLTEADLDQVVCELYGHPWPQSITDSFSRTFYTSQRAKARQNALETSGFGRSIPEHLRINKRARFLQPDEATETIQGFEEDLRIANSRFNINEATSSGDEIFDHSREAHRQEPARPESYGKVADEGQLFIYVGRDLAFRLARDFLAVDVTFDEETQSWAIRMPNGTDATGYGGGERDSMWVMTCFGPCIRIWTYTRGDDNIVAYFPEHDEGKSSYVDIAYEPRLLDIFDFMKKNVVPPQNYPESRPLDYQDVGGSSYTDTGVANDPLMVDTSFTFVLAEPTKADGSVPVTLPDGNRARLWAADWLPAQVYYQGDYHPCFAQKGRASGKWYWAWKR